MKAMQDLPPPSRRIRPDEEDDTFKVVFVLIPVV